MVFATNSYDFVSSKCFRCEELRKACCRSSQYLDCLKKVYRVEGVRALFRGAGYNALRTITSALALVAYGELKKRKRA